MDFLARLASRAVEGSYGLPVVRPRPVPRFAPERRDPGAFAPPGSANAFEVETYRPPGDEDRNRQGAVPGGEPGPLQAPTGRPEARRAAIDGRPREEGEEGRGGARSRGSAAARRGPAVEEPESTLSLEPLPPAAVPARYARSATEAEAAVTGPEQASQAGARPSDDPASTPTPTMDRVILPSDGSGDIDAPSRPRDAGPDRARTVGSAASPVGRDLESTQSTAVHGERDRARSRASLLPAASQGEQERAEVPFGTPPGDPARENAARGEELVTAQEQVVKITIGRIDVRAVPPPSPAPRPAVRPDRRLRLEDYLRTRGGAE